MDADAGRVDQGSDALSSRARAVRSAGLVDSVFRSSPANVDGTPHSAGTLRVARSFLAGLPETCPPARGTLLPDSATAATLNPLGSVIEFSSLLDDRC